MNVVILRGHLTRPPETRVLPSGDLLVSYEVTIAAEGDGRAESVPVVWLSAPASSADLEPATDVVVVGRVRRRFFRAGGTIQSRTEVVAAQVIPARSRARASRTIREVLTTAEQEVELLATKSHAS
jgi:single-strand DNA-binding protein